MAIGERTGAGKKNKERALRKTRSPRFLLSEFGMSHCSPYAAAIDQMKRLIVPGGCSSNTIRALSGSSKGLSEQTGYWS